MITKLYEKVDFLSPTVVLISQKDNWTEYQKSDAVETRKLIRKHLEINTPPVVHGVVSPPDIACASSPTCAYS